MNLLSAIVYTVACLLMVVAFWTGQPEVAIIFAVLLVVLQLQRIAEMLIVLIAHFGAEK